MKKANLVEKVANQTGLTKGIPAGKIPEFRAGKDLRED
jgi:nucleoid DNA-binding protein